MNSKNITLIKQSDLWKRIKRNKSFEGSYTHAPDGFNSLWCFFDSNVNNKTLKRYLRDGRTMCSSRERGICSACEYLDKNAIIECYGKRVIVFS